MGTSESHGDERSHAADVTDAKVTQQDKADARKFVLGELPTNRILYALALLGVLLPINSIISRSTGLAFTYLASHDFFLKGPYRLTFADFVYLAEGLLACAVYVYGFGFIFKVSILDRIGTVLYAVALLAPLSFFLFGILAEITDFINGFSWVVFYPLNILFNLIILIAEIVMVVAIASRVGGS